MRAQPSGAARLDRVRDKAHLVYGSITNFKTMMIRMVVLIIPMAIAVPFLMLWLKPMGVPLPVIAGMAGTVLMVAALFLTKRDFRKLAPRAGEMADAYLDEGICPCCAYNLAGVVRAADSSHAETGPQLVQCTECGASWSRTRIRNAQDDETADAREKLTVHTFLRAQAMLYSSMEHKDDAGRSISLARYSDLKFLRQAASGTYLQRLTECIAALRFWGLWKRLLFVSIILPVSVGIIVDFVQRPLSGFGVMQGLRAIGLVLWVIGAIAIIGSDLGRSGAKRVELLKQKRICPACGAELDAANGSDPSAVTCAECRAVWNLDVKEAQSTELAADPPRVEAR
ncbi:MAG: hypothetical protein ACREJD_13830 [Phycisphaerales bacterium]